MQVRNGVREYHGTRDAPLFARYIVEMMENEGKFAIQGLPCQKRSGGMVGEVVFSVDDYPVASYAQVCFNRNGCESRKETHCSDAMGAVRDALMDASPLVRMVLDGDNGNRYRVE